MAERNFLGRGRLSAIAARARTADLTVSAAWSSSRLGSFFTIMDAVAEIELLHCSYSKRCSRLACRYRARAIVRHLDDRGHLLRQFELCDNHVPLVVGERRAGVTIRDRRTDPN
jgi:hypothetical protein